MVKSIRNIELALGNYERKISQGEHENKLIVRITDNGNGIKKEHFERLFERFYRIDNSGNRTTGGSGLGLAIVKHIIDAHNEKIYVESDFGIGSEFSFSLEKSN